MASLMQQQPKGVNGGSNRIVAVNVSPSNNLPTPSHHDASSNHDQVLLKISQTFFYSSSSIFA